MCAELGGKPLPAPALLLLPALALLLLLPSARPAAATEATHPPEGPQDRTPQQKGRLSLQNTGMAWHGMAWRGQRGGLSARPPFLLCRVQL